MTNIYHHKMTAICTFEPNDTPSSGFTDIISAFYVEKENVLVGVINIDPKSIPANLTEEAKQLLVSFRELLVPLYLFRLTISDKRRAIGIPHPDNEEFSTPIPSQEFVTQQWEILHDELLRYTTEWNNIISSSPFDEIIKGSVLALRFRQHSEELHTILHNIHDLILDKDK